MKAYVVTTGIIFILVFAAHVVAFWLKASTW